MLKMSEPGFLFSNITIAVLRQYNKPVGIIIGLSMGFFQFGSLFIFVGQKLTKMTKADIVKQLAQETGVEAVTVLAVVEGFMEEVRAA